MAIYSSAGATSVATKAGSEQLLVAAKAANTARAEPKQDSY